MAVSRSRSTESVEYLESSYEESGSRPSGLDQSDLNSSFGSSNLEVNKDGQVVDYEREDGDGQEYESDEGQTITSGSSVGLDDHENIAPKSEKKLDDDEDRRNPQYIPKRGTFYEHDDRTADDDGSVNNVEKEGERAKEQLEKKKVWKEHENRWAHDKFNDDEQKPKTREELIELYGYDIRSEEGPPRARRRRRYGRGPNKYTRNWEDEDAYNKANSMSGQGRGGRRAGDRWEGDNRNSTNRNQSEGEPNGNQRRADYSNKVSGRRDDRRDNREAFPALPGSDAHRNDTYRPRSPQEERPKMSAPTNPAWKKEPPSGQNRVVREEYIKTKVITNSGPLQLTPPPVRREVELNRRRSEEQSGKSVREPLKIENHSPEFEPVKKGVGRGSGRRGGGATPAARGQGAVVQRGIYRGRGESRSEPPADKPGSQQQGQSPKLRTQDDLARDLARMSVYSQNQQTQGQEGQQTQMTREFTRKQQPEAAKAGGGASYQRQTVVPPRLQQQEAGANRPKRYSSLRQRSLPESGAPAVQPQPQPQAYNQGPHQYFQGEANVDPVAHFVNGHRSDPNVLTNSYQGYISSPQQGYVQQPVYGEAPQQQLPPQPPLQMMHPPTTYAAAFPSPPTFIQPVLRRPPSPHYLPPPPPPQAVLNFVQPQTQFSPQPYPPFQGYTAVNPAPPPTELYQPQGGITYYSPEEQVVPRAITRRQRSAIPIVPPPERQPRGRGRVTDSEAYEAMAGASNYADSGDNPDYEAHGDQTGVEYDTSGEQYQDYEGPGENAHSDFEDPSQLGYDHSGALQSESQLDYETSEDHRSTDYEDDGRLNHVESGDHKESDHKVIEDHTRTSGDQESSGQEVSEDVVESDTRPAEEPPKPESSSVEQISPNSEQSIPTEPSQSSTDAHEAGGERASDDKYEDAAEVITHEVQAAAS